MGAAGRGTRLGVSHAPAPLQGAMGRRGGRDRVRRRERTGSAEEERPELPGRTPHQTISCGIVP